MSFISVALDVLMVVLLGVTIGYAAVLNRRLSAWRKDKAELEKLIDRFNRAAQHADTGISTLKEASEQTGRALAQATAKGKSLCDDLAFLIERAEPIADRLVERTRRAERPGPVAPAAAAPEPYSIVAEPPKAPAAKETPKPQAVREPVPQSAPPARPAVRPIKLGASAAPRATAERNLLQALSSLRKA
jgi:hypothetical protein